MITNLGNDNFVKKTCFINNFKKIFHKFINSYVWDAGVVSIDFIYLCLIKKYFLPKHFIRTYILLN